MSRINTTQLNASRDLARWACVLLFLAGMFALFYPVYGPPYNCILFQLGCIPTVSHPFAGDAVALFLDAALFYVIARIAGRVLQAQREFAELEVKTKP